MAHNEQNQDYNSRLYQALIDERKELLVTAKEAAIQYAKAIMTLSAGALALSLTFIKNIVPKPFPGTLFYLKASWVSFSVSLTAIVISFLLSQFAFLKQIEIVQESFSNETKKDEGDHNSPTNPYKNWIVFLNVISLIFFILGVILIIWFSVSNVK